MRWFKNNNPQQPVNCPVRYCDEAWECLSQFASKAYDKRAETTAVYHNGYAWSYQELAVFQGDFSEHDKFEGRTDSDRPWAEGVCLDPPMAYLWRLPYGCRFSLDYDGDTFIKVGRQPDADEPLVIGQSGHGHQYYAFPPWTLVHLDELQAPRNARQIKGMQ